MKDPISMTREELVEEVVRLRGAQDRDRGALLGRRRDGRMIDDAEGRAGTAEMLKRKSATRSEERSERSSPRLGDFLSGIARASDRFGYALEVDASGRVLIAPSTNEFGGYAAIRSGNVVHLVSYLHGAAPENDSVVACGDDMHPEAREARAKAWREENAEAIAEHNRMIDEAGGGFPWPRSNGDQDC